VGAGGPYSDSNDFIAEANEMLALIDRRILASSSSETSPLWCRFANAASMAMSMVC